MQLEQLNEGLRFGAREINDVLTNRDLRIGFEFEYHVERDRAELFKDGATASPRSAIERTIVGYDDLYNSPEYDTESWNLVKADLREVLSDNMGEIEHGVDKITQNIHSSVTNQFVNSLVTKIGYHAGTDIKTEFNLDEAVSIRLYNLVLSIEQYEKNISTIEFLYKSYELFASALTEFKARWGVNHREQFLDMLQYVEPFLDTAIDKITFDIRGTDIDVPVGITIGNLFDIDNLMPTKSEFLESIPKMRRYYKALLSISTSDLFGVGDALSPSDLFGRSDEDTIRFIKYTLMKADQILTTTDNLLNAKPDMYEFGQNLIRLYNAGVADVDSYIMQHFKDHDNTTGGLDDFYDVVGVELYSMESPDVDLDDVIFTYIRNNPYHTIVNYEDEEIAGYGVVSQYGNASASDDKYKLVQIIDNVLSTNGMRWGVDHQHIEKVVVDYSVPNGVEVITHPMKIKDAMKMLKAMTDHIADVGSTSNRTGLHCNVSIKGLTNTEARKPNILKLVMLTDEKVVNLLFGVRTHVEKMFDDSSLANSLVDGLLFLSKNTSATTVIEEVFLKHIQKQEKYQRINLEHLNHINKELRRIEYRFLGDKDYEKSYNTLYWFVAKIAYVTMMSYTKENDREYLKILAKRADELLMKWKRITIADIRVRNKEFAIKDRELLDELLDGVSDDDLLGQIMRDSA